MTSEKIFEKDIKVFNQHGESRVNIPAAWREKTGLTPGAYVKIGLFYSSKYGWHVAVYNPAHQETFKNDK